jgi:hypothetical protein
VEIQETKEVRLFNVMTAVLRTQVFYGCWIWVINLTLIQTQMCKKVILLN